MPKIKNIYKKLIIIILLLLVSGYVSIQQYHFSDFTKGIVQGNQFNNYLIFKNSFNHLVEGKNLYVDYPTQQRDIFKYSPFFAMMMFPFSWMGNLLGLIAWSFLNLFIFYFSISRLKNFPFKQQLYVLIFCIPEIFVSIAYFQSNLLLVGLVILGYAQLERDRYFEGVLYIMISGFFKLFSISGLLLFFLYPQKKKFVLYSILCFLFLFLSPALICGVDSLLLQYRNFFTMLKNDQDNSIGMGLLGILVKITKIENLKQWVSILGLILLISPLFTLYRSNTPNRRLLYLSFIAQIWLIFNHKAESPTFIIGYAGAILMLYNLEIPLKIRTPLKIILIILLVFHSEVLRKVLPFQYYDMMLFKTFYLTSMMLLAFFWLLKFKPLVGKRKIKAIKA